jgi:hypothetical protein
MHHLAITAEKLFASSEFVRSAKPPTQDEIRKIMVRESVNDPMIHHQMHFALLLALERMNPKSFFFPYFETLPHPAIDDAKVMGLHKDVLNPVELLEWDGYQRLFISCIRAVLSSWGSGAPPEVVAHWAFRTVMARMHLLPDRGLTPMERGTSLNYSALESLMMVKEQESRLARFRSTIRSLLGQNAHEYRLVPTLVPVLDRVGHVPAANVSVEVVPRHGFGSCAELQAVTEIQEGEEVGLCFNRSHSAALTLYRFGFLPI